MFDADGRLILHNSQFCSLLGLPSEGVQRATGHRDIVELVMQAGGYEGYSPEDAWHMDAAFVSRRQAALDYLELRGRRIIAQSHQPLPDGGWVRTYADVTRRRQVEARIVHLAHHDALTDLPNRTLFRDELERALLNATDRSSVAVMLLDLNRFKEVNDTLGHAAGDQLLMLVGDRLQQIVGDRDTVARLGGDEFAIIQAAIPDKDKARQLAERVIAEIDVPYDINGATATIGVSVGISFAPADAAAADELLKRADEAMYHAKSRTKSSFCCFDEIGGAREQRLRGYPPIAARQRLVG